MTDAKRRDEDDAPKLWYKWRPGPGDLGRVERALRLALLAVIAGGVIWCGVQLREARRDIRNAGYDDTQVIAEIEKVQQQLDEIEANTSKATTDTEPPFSEWLSRRVVPQYSPPPRAPSMLADPEPYGGSARE